VANVGYEVNPMARSPSVQMQLRMLRTEHLRLKHAFAVIEDESKRFLGRALWAEAELKQWKERFDALLKIGGRTDD